MTDLELTEILRKIIIEQNNTFSKETKNILMNYKNSGGQQKTAEKLVEELANGFSENEILQDRIYDILDIITGWCGPEMRVWH